MSKCRGEAMERRIRFRNVIAQRAVPSRRVTRLSNISSPRSMPEVIDKAMQAQQRGKVGKSRDQYRCEAPYKAKQAEKGLQWSREGKRIKQERSGEEAIQTDREKTKERCRMNSVWNAPKKGTKGTKRRMGLAALVVGRKRATYRNKQLEQGRTER